LIDDFFFDDEEKKRQEDRSCLAFFLCVCFVADGDGCKMGGNHLFLFSEILTTYYKEGKKKRKSGRRFPS